MLVRIDSLFLGTVETGAEVRRAQGQEQEESLRMFFGDRRSDLDLDEEATLREVSVKRKMTRKDLIHFNHMAWKAFYICIYKERVFILLALH